MNDATDQHLRMMWAAGAAHGTLMVIRDLLLSRNADNTALALRKANESLELIERMLFPKGDQ